MELRNVLHKQFSEAFGDGQSRTGNEVRLLGKRVYHYQDESLSFIGREICD